MYYTLVKYEDNFSGFIKKGFGIFDGEWLEEFIKKDKDKPFSFDFTKYINKEAFFKHCEKYHLTENEGKTFINCNLKIYGDFPDLEKL